MRRLLIALFGLLLLSGCLQQQLPSEKYCSQDSDCACGTHKTTGECFYGNKAYVNTGKQCPDYCTGIAAMFETKCVNDTCTQVRVR